MITSYSPLVNKKKNTTFSAETVSRIQYDVNTKQRGQTRNNKTVTNFQWDTSVSLRMLSLPFTSALFSPLSIHQCSWVPVRSPQINLRWLNTFNKLWVPCVCL